MPCASDQLTGLPTQKAVESGHQTAWPDSCLLSASQDGHLHPNHTAVIKPGKGHLSACLSRPTHGDPAQFLDHYTQHPLRILYPRSPVETLPGFSSRTGEGKLPGRPVIWPVTEMSLGLPGYEDFDPKE